MPSNARRTSARSRVDVRSQRLSESAAQAARIRPMIACAWRNRCSVSSNGSATKSQLMPLDRTTLRRAGNRSSPWGDQNSRAAAPRPGSAGREAHRTAVFSSTSRTRQRRSTARNANIAPAFIGSEARPAATFNGILANAATPFYRARRKHRACVHRLRGAPGSDVQRHPRKRRKAVPPRATQTSRLRSSAPRRAWQRRSATTSRTPQRRSTARNANIAPAFIGSEARPAATFSDNLANAATPFHRAR
jgi:hypothetical protein